MNPGPPLDRRVVELGRTRAHLETDSRQTDKVTLAFHSGDCFVLLHLTLTDLELSYVPKAILVCVCGSIADFAMDRRTCFDLTAGTFILETKLKSGTRVTQSFCVLCFNLSE